MHRSAPRRGLALGILLLAAAALGCFTGDELAQQPCESDEDCNPTVDLFGKALKCTHNICDYTPRCGDGIVDGVEECDDGNQDDRDECLATCKDARCGDLIVQIGEECDDGNKVNTDACAAGCTLAWCGDGVTRAGVEACDDGDDSDLNQCRNDCTLARCGDGVVQAGVEACDDGDKDETDECVSSCEPARCGDGFVRAGVEACDDANADDADPCLVDCRANTCGDGFVDVTREGCDDQNLADNDGCNNTCRQGAMAIGSGTSAQHMCAIRDGLLRCWGANNAGQIGRGNNAGLGDEPGELPQAIFDLPVDPRGLAVVRVGAGIEHTCALLADGLLRCWGSNLEDQLGNGLENTTWGVRLGDLPMPVTLSSGPTIDVGGGVTHTCAVLVGGGVECWGTGMDGQLGLMTTHAQLPTAVEVGGEAVQIAVGKAHTCVLLTGGAVRCWGRNSFGQLGYPGQANVGLDETPASQPPVDVGGEVVQIAAGDQHTCAVLMGGTVRCWGSGEYGKLGYGDALNVGVDAPPSAAGDVKMLQPGDQAQKVVTGAVVTCVLLVGGGVRCWGAGVFLGYGGVTNYGDTPDIPPWVELGGGARDLAAGSSAVCALLEGGALQCWGFGGSGLLGINNTVDIGGQPGEMVPPQYALIYPNP